MASLPLFSPSFMPKDGASFAPARPATPAAPSTRTASVAGVDARTPVARPPLPVMRSLFDPLPSPSHSRPTVARPAETRTGPVVPASTVERTEATLREAGFAGRFWRGDTLSVSPLPSRPSGFRALDEQLPNGGWPSRCMIELLLAHTGVGEIRLLASTLSSLTQAGREIVLLSPPHIPDPTGWEQMGIDMRRVLIIRTPRPADRLWALEQSLKSDAFGALIAWLPEERTLARHDVLRRLQLAAATTDGLTFVMRPLQARHHASPAPLRLALSIGKPEGHRQKIVVQLLKRRGPVLTKPLTLTLPEIYRGMKAFNPVDNATAPTRPLPSSQTAVSKSITAHALAGPVLSDARA